MQANYMVTVGITALALTAAGCAGGASSTPDPADDGGQIVVSGSSTVEPISALVAEKFNAANPGVSISVDGPGTSDGFELFCNGETDISDASRPIKAEEIETCEDNGIDFIELKVAIDGISVLTAQNNDSVTCLDYQDLYALLGPESQGFRRWSDANELAAELGASHAPYPDAPLVITAPGEESGTYDTFVELVLAGIAEDRGEEEESRPDYQASANDNVIIEGISGAESSLGWVGYAFYVQNEGIVKALEVDGGDGCVAPNDETIADGSYPIARPLFIYVNAQRTDDNPALADYVDLYLSDEGLASVAEVGYVSLADDEIAATIQTWEQRTTGTREEV